MPISGDEGEEDKKRFSLAAIVVELREANDWHKKQWKNTYSELAKVKEDLHVEKTKPSTFHIGFLVGFGLAIIVIGMLAVVISS